MVYLPPPTRVKATPVQKFLSSMFTDVYLKCLGFYLAHSKHLLNYIHKSNE